MYLFQTRYKKPKQTNKQKSKKENFTFIHIFTGQETKKEARNAKASLPPVWREKTATEFRKPFVINVHPASEGKCLHFLTSSVSSGNNDQSEGAIYGLLSPTSRRDREYSLEIHQDGVNFLQST